MRHQLYQFIHLTGIFMIFLAYGGLIVRNLVGSDSKDIRRLGAITSGIGMLLSLVGGFGLLAVLKYGWPLWVLVKLVIWILLGAMIVVINRKPNLSQVWWWSTVILGMIALYMVILKPGS